jgi:rare lipoprotein A
MLQQEFLDQTRHENAHPSAAAARIGEPWGRPIAPGQAISSPHGGHVMRTWLAVLGLFGVLLITIPDVTYGGSSQAGQVGWASWYGKRHEGRKTASGERFSRGQLTAAHRSLPLGTRVQVTNLRTGQRVVVRITDRGPHGGGKRRIIDLSEAAAKRIGLTPRGIERVQVTVVENAA